MMTTALPAVAGDVLKFAVRSSLLSLLVLATPWCARAADCVRWTLRTDAGAPEARAGHVMAYDSDRGVTVLFGGHRFAEVGVNLVYFNDTWEYDGNSWQRIVIDGPSPLWRTASAMCYDSVRHEMVLAGGYNGDEDENDGYLYDCWVYRTSGPGHGVWTRSSNLASLSIEPKDGARVGHAMVFDSKRGVAVLVGGTKAENPFVSAPDTTRTSSVLERYSSSQRWSYIKDLFDYILKEGAELYTYYEGPTGHVLVYDSDSGVISLGGGAYYYFLKYDQWRDLDWEQFFPITKAGQYATPIRNRPLGGEFIGHRRNFAAAYDTDRKRIVVFGGNLAGENQEGNEDPGGRLDELRFVTSSSGASGYTGIRPNIKTPPPRELHAMVYDTRRKCIVLFGGSRYLTSFYSDTWEYGLGVVPSFYIQKTNSGTPNGSPAQPFQTISQAVAAAAPDCPTTLRVAGGDYKEGALSLRKPMRLEPRNGPVRIH